jgi:hypothetical protein
LCGECAGEDHLGRVVVECETEVGAVIWKPVGVGGAEAGCLFGCKVGILVAEGDVRVLSGVFVMGCTFGDFECEAISFSPVNRCNEALPKVTVGEADPPKSGQIVHVGQLLGDVSGVDLDDYVNDWGVLYNVKEGAELHGVYRDGFVTKDEVGS